MFDNISFRINNYATTEFHAFLDLVSIEEPPYWNDRYRVDWHNLRICYFPNSQILQISNSLHKFYYAEIAKIGAVNHTDFTYSQVVEAVKFLEVIFARPASAMIIQGRFEYGVNISTGSIKPFEIISRYQSLVTTATNEFYAVENRDGGKPIMKSCYLTEYTVKFYDKGKQSNIYWQNILRYEIVNTGIGKTKSIIKKHIVTLEDLCDKETWVKLSLMLTDTFESIRMLPFKNDNIDEYTKLLCYASPQVNKDYKTALKPIRKELEKLHTQMKMDGSNPHSLVREGIYTKLPYLMNN